MRQMLTSPIRREDTKISPTKRNSFRPIPRASGAMTTPGKCTLGVPIAVSREPPGFFGAGSAASSPARPASSNGHGEPRPHRKTQAPRERGPGGSAMNEKHPPSSPEAPHPRRLPSGAGVEAVLTQSRAAGSKFAGQRSPPPSIVRGEGRGVGGQKQARARPPRAPPWRFLAGRGREAGTAPRRPRPSAPAPITPPQ